jgi:hypothetical protein
VRIFIFEDDWGRIEWFEEKFDGCHIDYTEDVQHASNLLATQKYDLIFLDHDIHAMMGMKGTGSHLVINMTKDDSVQGYNGDTPIYIHSLNTNGAMRMEGILMFHGFWNVSRVPFTQLRTLIRVQES